MKKILTPYQIGGKDMVEVARWNQVGAGNPKAVPLPGESGVWMLVNVNNPARDASGAMTPSAETFEQVMADINGNQSVVNIPVSMDLGPAYWDYYNLPLKPGVTIP